MRFINFGHLDIKFLIPITGGIVRLIYKYVIVLNDKYEALECNPFLISIYAYIGMIFAFIPYLIFKYRSKEVFINSVNSEILQTKSKLDIELLVHPDIFEGVKYNKYKYIAITSIFDLINTLLSCIFCRNVVYNLWIFDIIFISLFSYIILKSKLYKHQYITMIIILLLGFALNIIEYFKLDESKNSLNFIEIFTKFLTEIFFSLAIVIIKYNLEKNFCSPYEICIWEGLLGLIMNIICLLIINAVGVTIDNIEYPNNIKQYFSNYNFNDFIVSLMVILVNFIYNTSLMLTCNYFTPAHILIISIIKEYHYYLQKEGNLILNLVGFIILVIILFMFLIFVEIIELNIFNISYNTKKNIEIRSVLDSLVDNNDNNDNNDNIIGLNEEIKSEEIKSEEESRINSTFSITSDNL